MSYVALLVLLTGAVLFTRVNRSPSLPTGLYLSVPWGTPSAGDDAFVCMPPGAAARLAVERGYLAESDRDCASRAIPLLKHVRAAAGDTVLLNAAGAFVRGRRIALPPPMHDRYNRPLQPVFGRYPLSPGSLWLGSDIAAGYDSRYLGPIPDSLVVGRAYLFVRF